MKASRPASDLAVAKRPAGRAAATGSTARPDRKGDILMAAQRLFAQQGYNAVSIRQIAEEAGVPIALVSYYYGPKTELFHAIFDSWSGTIAERLRRLDEALKVPPAAGMLYGIVQAFIEPVLSLRHSKEGEHYALMVARELGYAHVDSDKVLSVHFDPLANAFIEGIRQALPQATRAQATWCYQFALGAMLHHLRDRRVHHLSQGESRPDDEEGQRMLVDFIVGGVRAAIPPAATPARPVR